MRLGIQTDKLPEEKMNEEGWRDEFRGEFRDKQYFEVM